MTNLVFNQLGKCGETYYVDMSNQALHNSISIKNLVDDYHALRKFIVCFLIGLI